MMAPRRWAIGRAVVGLLLLAVAIGGCAPTAASPSASPNSTAGVVGTGKPRPAVVVPASLVGSYTAVITGTTATSGTWKLDITKGDILLTNPHGSESFSLEPSAVTESALTVMPAVDCPDQVTVTEGMYTLHLEGDTLTFTAVTDSCGDRKATLTTMPWRRTP